MPAAAARQVLPGRVRPAPDGCCGWRCRSGRGSGRSHRACRRGRPSAAADAPVPQDSCPRRARTARTGSRRGGPPGRRARTGQRLREEPGRLACARSSRGRTGHRAGVVRDCSRSRRLSTSIGASSSHAVQRSQPGNGTAGTPTRSAGSFPPSWSDSGSQGAGRSSLIDLSRELPDCTHEQCGGTRRSAVAQPVRRRNATRPGPHEHREVGQVHECADAAGEHQMAGPCRPDAAIVLAVHSFSPSLVSPCGAIGLASGPGTTMPAR